MCGKRGGFFHRARWRPFGVQTLLHRVGQNEAADCFYYVMELADDVERGQEIAPETYRA